MTKKEMDLKMLEVFQGPRLKKKLPLRVKVYEENKPTPNYKYLKEDKQSYERI